MLNEERLLMRTMIHEEARKVARDLATRKLPTSRKNRLADRQLAVISSQEWG